MEDTLRGRAIYLGKRTMLVIILALMEDTLRVHNYTTNDTSYKVLILVLMEDTLRGDIKIGDKVCNKS